MDVFVADMSSQSEVRRLAAEVLQRLPRIDVLVNNVGGYWNTRHVTADGLERTFALNHLAPFLLTNLLLDRLRQSAPARVVTVSSNAHSHGPDRLRRPPGRTVLLRARGPTASPSSPTSCSPTSWPGGCRAPRHRQCAAPGRGEHLVRSRGPRPASSACSSRSCGPFMKSPGPGRRHLHPSRVRPRSRAGHRPLLRQQQGEAVRRGAATTGRPPAGSGRSVPTWSTSTALLTARPDALLVARARWGPRCARRATGRRPER